MIPYNVTQVEISKEGLPLYKGESVHDFLRAMSMATQSAYAQKFSLKKNEDYIYMMEVYQSAVIFEVCKTKAADPKDAYRFYAATYKRKEDGSFTFENTTEVMRVTRYEPVPSAAVAKSLKEGLPEHKLLIDEE